MRCGGMRERGLTGLPDAAGAWRRDGCVVLPGCLDGAALEAPGVTLPPCIPAPGSTAPPPARGAAGSMPAVSPARSSPCLSPRPRCAALPVTARSPPASRRVLGEDHPRTLSVIANLAEIEQGTTGPQPLPDTQDTQQQDKQNPRDCCRPRSSSVPALPLLRPWNRWQAPSTVCSRDARDVSGCCAGQADRRMR